MNMFRCSTLAATSLKHLAYLAAGTSLIVSAVACSTNTAQAGAEPYIGEIYYYPYTFCPSGYAEANGQILQISQNAALYALLGPRFGGNGTSNFGLPAVKPMLDANGVRLIACIATVGIFPSRP